MKIRQFFVAKFKSSRLKQFKYNVDCTFRDLFYNGEIVQLADNQVLRSIRNIKNIEVDFNEVDNLYKRRNEIKRLDNSKENRNLINKLQDEINSMIQQNVDHLEKKTTC